MARRAGPIKRKEFKPKEAREIEGKKDWDEIFSLPWPEREWNVLRSMEQAATCQLSTDRASAYDYGNAKDARAAINLVFLVCDLNYRLTHSFPGGNYRHLMKLVKF
jgi:hypothetical protein